MTNRTEMTPRELAISLYALAIVQNNAEAKAVASDLGKACNGFTLSKNAALLSRAVAMVAEMAA